MAENSGRTSTKPPLTTYQLIAIVAVIFALAALTYFAFRLFTTGVEPPIRVRNGSMLIELAGIQEWKADGDAWTPSDGKSAGTFQVKVDASGDAVCEGGTAASGKDISIWYSDNTEVRFKLSGLFGKKTKVWPKDTLARADPRSLRYEQVGVSGYIARVEVKGTPLKCTFSSASQLNAINICPVSNPACQ
jgi:hypothetical protein